MDAIRWILILVAVGTAAAAALWLALSGPAAAPGPSPEPATVAALPLSSAGSAASAVSAAAPTPASAAAVAPPPIPRPAAPRIGSEGYGPPIERALAGSDAVAAWEAVQWLRGCASTEQRRSSFELARAQGVAPEMLTQMMQEVDAEARRCQTVTPQHRALLPELASRAIRAGVPEAAAAYAAAAFANDLTPAQRQAVADAMRRDAQAGHAMSLLNAVTAHERWGLSDAERLAFMHAYAGLPDQPGAQATLASLAKQGAIKFSTPPTQQQLDAARVEGQRILDRLKTTAGRP